MLLADAGHGTPLLDIILALFTLAASAVGIVVWWLVQRSVKAVDKRQDDCDKRSSYLDDRERKHHESCLVDMGRMSARIAKLEGKAD